MNSFGGKTLDVKPSNVRVYCTRGREWLVLRYRVRYHPGRTVLPGYHLHLERSILHDVRKPRMILLNNEIYFDTVHTNTATFFIHIMGNLTTPPSFTWLPPIDRPTLIFIAGFFWKGERKTPRSVCYDMRSAKTKNTAQRTTTNRQTDNTTKKSCATQRTLP